MRKTVILDASVISGQLVQLRRAVQLGRTWKMLAYEYH